MTTELPPQLDQAERPPTTNGFIRHLRIPYCVLYDRGYTSLGGTTDTSPNPALKRTGAAAEGVSETFRPAYELMADDEERLGRDR
ncbi:FAD synthetase [Magnaporthiopsis poae ATCC 64411]|uniref:FAD synthetase n=1 Tax=Magnaporthiopsis poae (strain ATCC 64411 / 73-15) TaxID=644358 RepID=A0A0C4DNI5_MAGP6|nr:FAD synthetase [Magnaporthiopsis poae ATCC 64411]